MNAERLQLKQENWLLEAAKRERDELQKGLQNEVQTPDYQAARDRILKNWRLAKGPEKKERIKEALDRFIEALDSMPPSIPTSTPTALVVEWVRYALEDLALGEIGNANRSLRQALASVEPPKAKAQEPPDGTAAPLVNEVVKKLTTVPWYKRENLFDDLRPIAEQCGYKLFKEVKGLGTSLEQWFICPLGQPGQQLFKSGNHLAIADWLREQNLITND